MIYRNVTVPLKFLLSHLVTPNTIERINLIFIDYHEDLQGWREIDAVLDCERFAALRHVGLYILMSEYDAWIMKLSGQLQSLSSRGILHVHSSKVCVRYTDNLVPLIRSICMTQHLYLEIGRDSSIIGRDLDWWND
jgi:hypothetical protein